MPSLRHAAANVDHARRPEVGPGEFFFARPDQLHGLVRGLGQPRRFDGRFTGVLAAVGRAGVRNDHAYAYLRES